MRIPKEFQITGGYYIALHYRFGITSITSSNKSQTFNCGNQGVEANLHKFYETRGLSDWKRRR
jgi:hypothetical protein